MITVSIVDDDEKLRRSIAAFLDGWPEFRCVSAYSSAAEALKHLPADNPDVVLMDINMGEMNGIECVARLKMAMPATRVVMLTVYEDSERIFSALKVGACGYLLKRLSPTKLLEAIKEAHEGGAPMSSSIAAKVVASFQSVGSKPEESVPLAPKEETVLNHLAQGLTYKQIADRMGISIETVRSYIRRIYEKLHVQSRTEAVYKFFRR